MFVSPFEKNVSYVLLRDDASLQLSLPPEEEAVISEIGSEVRKQEFRLGRTAARVALEGLGIAVPPPILRGKTREPLWPAGVVGSITHGGAMGVGKRPRPENCPAIISPPVFPVAIAIAVCAWKSELRGVGIDLQELWSATLVDISRKIAVGTELDWIGRGPESRKKLLMLFSAKESVYKTFQPLTSVLTSVSLGFHDVELEWDDSASRFQGMLLVDIGEDFSRGFCFTVGVQFHEKFIFTYMSVN